LSEEEKTENVEEAEEVTETLEEAPADYVVDVDGLEVMIKVSDLLYEATRASDPAKYIEEIEKITSTSVPKEKRRSRRRVSKKAETSKEKKSGKKQRRGSKGRR
jgi:hypothetical protein